MKSTPTLSVLRNIFYCFEWASGILAGLVLVLSWVVAPHALSRPKTGNGVSGWGPPIYRFAFSLEPLQTAPVEYRGTTNDSVMVTNLRADVLVSRAESSSRLLTFLRWRSATGSLLLGLTCAIFSLMRRLFDHVKKGEAFSSQSVRLIRLMGWSCFVYAAAASILNSALDWWIAGDLRQHLMIKDLNTGFLSADTEDGFNIFFSQLHLKLDLTTVLIGLIAIALAEVFRQGMLMKEESELTV